MLDSLLSNSVAGDSLTFAGTLLSIGSALVLGLFISLVYIATHKTETYQPSFTVSLIMLPAIIAMIILLVGSNVARAFSLAGAFSLIRFRSALGDAKDIAYVFFTVGVGLACGMGYVGYAAIFAVILCGVMVVLTTVHFGTHGHGAMRLKILMPEDMEYQQVFDDILQEYTITYKLMQVKTSEFGSLFELMYQLRLKDMGQSKQFIDKLRCKNGNLNIILTMDEAVKTVAI